MKNYTPRQITHFIQAALAKGKSILLLGPRQTGKSTLGQTLNPTREISLLRADERLRYETNPHLLQNEIEQLAKMSDDCPLILVDEVQKIPALLDPIQYLIDKGIAQFILTGSSARKLRQTKANWLPGRVRFMLLDPFMLAELNLAATSLDDLLAYGSLPRIIAEPDEKEKKLELHSYVSTYLADEIRGEALVRQISDFARFLPLAAMESGKLVNMNHLSQELGISRHTIMNYYQILEDCLIIEKIQPLTQSKTRLRLNKTPKYLFFDLGVRNIAAEEDFKFSSAEKKGALFEQFIGLELLRFLRANQTLGSLHFWRDNNGPEVDWVVKVNNQLIPIEVKWTDKPTGKDARHLELFLSEYDSAQTAYVICRTPYALQLSERITALPWFELAQIFAEKIR